MDNEFFLFSFLEKNKIIFLLFSFLPITSVSQSFLKDTTRLEEVIIWGERQKKHNSSQVVDSLQIKQNKTLSFSELLSQNSSIFIKSYGLGSISTASFRGTSASHTEVSWNGIPINNPMLGQVDFSLLPVWIADKTNISYGSSSLVNSNGALGGSVNINSSPLWDKKLYGSILQTAESFSTFKTFISVGGGSKNFQSKIRYCFASAENDFPFYNNAVLPFKYVKQTNADYLMHNLTGDFYFRTDSKNLLSLNLWYGYNDRNIPPIMSYQGSGKTEYQKDNDLKIVLKWNNFPSEKLKNDIILGYANNNNSYFLSNSTDIGQYVSYNTNNSFNSFFTKYNLSLKIKKELNFNFSLTADYHKVISFNQAKQNQNYSADRFESYAKANILWTISDYVSLLGLIKQGFADNRFLAPIPYLSIEILPLKSNDLSIKTNFSRNFHLPTLNDLYWIPGGNSELKPEKGYSGDISINYNLKIQNFLMTINSSGFVSIIEDWIMWQPSKFFYWQASNLKKVLSKGIEINYKTYYSIKQVNINLSSNYSFTSTKNLNSYSENDLSKGKQLIYIPKHRANCSVDISYKGFYFNYNWLFTSERFTTSDNSQKLPYYNLHNIYVGKNLKNFDIQIKIDNIFSEKYQAILWRACPEISFSFSLKYNFSINN